MKSPTTNLRLTPELEAVLARFQARAAEMGDPPGTFAAEVRTALAVAAEAPKVSWARAANFPKLPQKQREKGGQ